MSCSLYINSTKYFPPSSIYNILQGQSMGKRYIITFQKVSKSYSGNKNGGQFSIMYISLIRRFYNKISKHRQKIDMGFDRTMFGQYSTHKIKTQIPQMKFKTVDLIIFFSAIQFFHSNFFSTWNSSKSTSSKLYKFIFKWQR